MLSTGGKINDDISSTGGLDSGTLLFSSLGTIMLQKYSITVLDTVLKTKKGDSAVYNKLPASTWSCDSESGIYLLFSSSPQKIETGSLSFSFDEPMY